MSASDRCHVHLESPAAGATLAPGRHRLCGWAFGTADAPVADLRARVGGRLFPGILGFPRADVAAHFRTGRPVALAGFEVVMTLTPGSSSAVLEALFLDGVWRPVLAVTFTVDPAAPAADVPMPATAALRWHEYGRALRTLLRAARRTPEVPVAELAARVVAALPAPTRLRDPHPPFRGHLDEPAAFSLNGYGRIAVLGHLFHESGPLHRVLATFDLQAWQPIGHNRPSPDVAAHFPSVPHAGVCALYGLADAPAQLPSPLTLRLYAELADGSVHLCAAVRTAPHTQEDEKAPWPAADRLDVTAADAALRRALAAAGHKLGDAAEIAAEFARLRTESTRRSPRATAAVPPLQPAPAAITAPLPERVLLVTHNLNWEGAPLFLLDYAAHLASRGVHLTVLSPSEGPLRARFAALGADVRLADVSVVFDSGATGPIEALARDPLFASAGLVVCNTFTTFWAVHAAKRAGRRVLLYVHESTTPAGFYQQRVPAAVIALAEEAFMLADTISFTTAATRAYHTGYGRPENHRLAPGWIGAARIDACLATFSRAEWRARHGIAPDELLVANIGTVCDRKGQHIFARAVDLLWRRDPALAARTRFVMLGGGDTPFDTVLADLLAELGRSNLQVHPATADYLGYYAAADLFVCSTYEESSPRVVLEAMVCGTPLLASAVHGIPEQVRAGIDGILVPPGDTWALATAMASCLADPAAAQARAARARARVVAEFDAAVLLPRHAALAAATARG